MHKGKSKGGSRGTEGCVSLSFFVFGPCIQFWLAWEDKCAHPVKYRNFTSQPSSNANVLNQDSVDQGLPAAQIHQILMCIPLSTEWDSRLGRTKWPQSARSTSIWGQPDPSATPTDIPVQARARELISRVIGEEKIETPKKGLIVACTSTVLTYISCRCFLSLKTVWCCSSFQNSDRNVVEPENMASEKELQLNLCQQKLYIYCIRFVKGFIGRKIVRDTKIQTCEVISLQSGLFLCPEVKWFIRISPSPLLCLSSFYFPLVSNLIFCWNSLRQHMCTVCLQPRTHTSPIKILYYPCTHWEYTSLSISISFSLPSTWLCISLSPDSQAFSLSLSSMNWCVQKMYWSI